MNRRDVILMPLRLLVGLVLGRLELGKVAAFDYDLAHDIDMLYGGPQILGVIAHKATGLHALATVPQRAITWQDIEEVWGPSLGGLMVEMTPNPVITVPWRIATDRQRTFLPEVHNA